MQNIHYLIIGLALLFAVCAVIVKPFSPWPVVFAVVLMGIELFSRVSKAVVIGGLALLLTGCVQVTGTRSADGALSINTHRFFWASEGISFTLANSTNGVMSTTLTVQKSSVDAAAITAMATLAGQLVGQAAVAAATAK
jgi:hypothetical protein